MRKLKSALLYTALAIVANAATAESPAPYEFNPADLPKLIWHADPVAPSTVTFTAEDGSEMEVKVAAESGEVLKVKADDEDCSKDRDHDDDDVDDDEDA